MEVPIKFETAKLAREKKCNMETLSYFNVAGEKYTCKYDLPDDIEIIKCYTQSELQKFIREKRGVHIEIHRNASGYYWSMCKSNSGTELGWSDISGPNDSGVWDSFESALENALQIQLSYDLPDNTTVIKHWGNYVNFALKLIK